MRHLKLLCFLLFALTIETCWSQITIQKDKEGNYQRLLFESKANGEGQAKQQNSSIKEFDLEANNPFNKLSLNGSADSRGRRMYHIRSYDKNVVKSALMLENDDVLEQAYHLSSHFFLDRNDNYAIVAYNGNLMDEEYNVIAEARASELLVLDKEGDEKWRKRINSDAFAPIVSENGKFLAYFRGEHLEHSRPSETGLTIINLENNEILYEENVSVYNATNFQNMLILACRIPGKRRLVVLDCLSGHLYELNYDKSIQFMGYQHFRKFSGEDIFLTRHFNVIK